MNVLIDSTGTMYFGEERETVRNCPRCHAFSRMSPTAIPTFDELLLQKPRAIGVVLRCHACNSPVFLRYATRAFANNRVELSPQAFDVERPIEKFAFNYVPEDVETFFREALICYSHNQFQAFAAMCRRSAAVTFADLGHSTKLRLFDSISDVREMAQIDEAATFNGTPYLVAATLFVAITIPQARFTDWLVARDRRRRQAAGVAV